MKETNIQNLSLIQASKNKGVYIYRNAVGTYYTRTEQPVKIGVIGSADALGCISLEITADMIGKTIPIFFASEFKRPKVGRQSEEQKRWQKHVESLGVPYRLITSVDEMQNYIDDIKNGKLFK